MKIKYFTYKYVGNVNNKLFFVVFLISYYFKITFTTHKNSLITGNSEARVLVFESCLLTTL